MSLTTWTAATISRRRSPRYPALGVYLLQGHAWQMDGHMYFFVALAALTVLCDWRPIVLASALIASEDKVMMTEAEGILSSADARPSASTTSEATASMPAVLS